MMESLSIKSEHRSTACDTGRSATITASELLSKFSMKSPTSSKICLTDRGPSSARSINNSKHNSSTFQPNRPKRDKQEGLVELRDHSNRNPGKGKEQAKAKSNINCRQNIVRMINDISKKAKNGVKLDLPVRKIVKGKENVCLTQRSRTPLGSQRSLALKMNICLENAPAFAPKTSVNNTEEPYFRKSSDTSTLSMKTKHTASVHQLEEQSDSLFARPQMSSILQGSKGQGNLLNNLQQAKKKLYKQIYLLDKKLLNDYHHTQASQVQEKSGGRKAILITLRKKQSKRQEFESKVDTQ